MSGNIVLYIDAFWANPWDSAPYVALREKGVPFSTAIALCARRSGEGPAFASYIEHSRPPHAPG